jgi:hypothetical protein
VVAQALGLVLLVIGFALGVQSVRDKDEENFEHSLHGKLGFAIFVLAGAQFLGGLARPHTDPDEALKTTTRRAWEILHKVVGWAVVLLGFINVFLGLDLDDEGGNEGGGGDDDDGDDDEGEGGGSDTFVVLHAIWFVIFLAAECLWLYRLWASMCQSRRGSAGGGGNAMPSMVQYV